MNCTVPTPSEYVRDLLRIGLDVSVLVVEASSVAACRMRIISGFESRGGDEIQRMFPEKPGAFAASGLAAVWMAIGGQRPDRVMAAALYPLRETTHNNLRRLGGAGDTGI